MTRPNNTLAETFIKGVEACKLVGYPDSGGVPTDGYGHTGAEVRIGGTITQADADADLLDDLGIAGERLSNRLIPSREAALSDHQYAALESFVFNLGAEPDWTIWKVINAGQLDQVPDQIKRFDKVRKNGVLVSIPGLDHRRLAEVALWNTADVGAAVAVALAAPVAPPPSGETRAADTPQTPADVTPLHKSGSAWASGATAIAAVGLPIVQHAQEGLKQVVGVIAPYGDGAPVVATVSQYMEMGLAGMAVVALILLWAQHLKAKAA